MKIVLLEGSPNKNGSSNTLANAFIEGAKEAGHSVDVIDAAHANIHPCTGCIHCGYEGPCVQKDDVDDIRARPRGGHDGVRHASLLLWHVRPAENPRGQVLRLQFLHPAQAHEVGDDCGGMECGRPDVRGVGGSL